MTAPENSATGFVADTMVLAMFVDAGQVELLVSLASGRLFVTPTVASQDELPPYADEPVAEFARGLFRSQIEAGDLHVNRVARRTAFYQAAGALWSPVALTVAELLHAAKLSHPATRAAARAIDPAFKFKRIGAGEAEAAAVSVSRDWTLWSDDSAIVGVLAALHPSHPVERIGRLLMRAVSEGLLNCEDAVHLYNDTFKKDFGLWTSLTLRCHRGRLIAN